MMQRMYGVSLTKHLSIEALRGRFGIDCVSDLVETLAELQELVWSC